MQTPKKEDEKLQMLFDGELEPHEEAAVRQSLESSPEARAQLREWQELRTAMKSASMDWGAEIDSDALFARIEADINAPPVPLRRPEPETPSPQVIPGNFERRIWGTVATGFAVAAAVVLAVITWPGSSDGPRTQIRGSEVLEIDFGSNTGTIFEVEGGAGESLAVVWIDDGEVGRP